MTHEDPEHRSYDEHPRGPEHDYALPDATTIPEYSDVEQSFAPPVEVITTPAQTEVIGAEPGWWNHAEPATQLPHWSGPTENEA